MKVKRDWGGAGKVAVFGLLKRGGKVYTAGFLMSKTGTLMPIIEDRIIYTDCWRSYNELNISEFKHYRINHSTQFAEQ